MPDPKQSDHARTPGVKRSQEPARDQESAEAEAATRAEEEARLTEFEEFLIDEAGRETFPASDPPSWTPLVITRHPPSRPALAPPSPEKTAAKEKPEK
jgi:hypothetical protein